MTDGHVGGSTWQVADVRVRHRSLSQKRRNQQEAGFSPASLSPGVSVTDGVELCSCLHYFRCVFVLFFPFPFFPFFCFSPIGPSESTQVVFELNSTALGAPHLACSVFICRTTNFGSARVRNSLAERCCQKEAVVSTLNISWKHSHYSGLVNSRFWGTMIVAGSGSQLRRP